MHKNYGEDDGHGPGGGDHASAVELQDYEIIRVAKKDKPAETHAIKARDLYDAIGQARRLVGIGEVKIRQQGRQLCFLHLESPTRWWVEVNETQKSG